MAIVLRITLLLVFISQPLLAMANQAVDLSSPPQSKVLLTLGGDIAIHNADSVLQLDRQMLESLPRTSFSTRTPWTVGSSTFTGVAVRDLLKAAGAGSQRFSAVATDDYIITVEGVDFERYPIVIAYELDGKPMSLRDLGPLWLMFPFDDHPELLTEINKAFCVWQIREIKIL